VPDLHVDIMNPHYGDYYGADTSRTPPADYLNPVPIKFLTVAKDTAFIFRALVGKNQVDLVKKVKNAFEKALTAEGVGAKTAVGYGRFDILTDSESVSGFLETKQQQPVAVVQDIKTPLEKLLDALNLLNSSETGRISGEIINKMDIMLESDHEKADVARAIKEKLSAKAFKKLDKKKYGYLSKLTEKGEK
jgi:CRISPR/Cas system CMR subunit Cmr6 (Cas7 group RAMP superfamily)